MGCSASTIGSIPDKTGTAFSEDSTCQGYNEGPYWVSDVTQSKVIRFAKEGAASLEECPPMTLAQIFKKAATVSPDKPALLAEWPVPALLADGTAPPALARDKWKTWTWKGYYDEVYDAAKGFAVLGAQPFDGVIVYGFNSPWWIMAQMSGILAGCCSAGIYPTDSRGQIMYKSKYANAAVAVCGDDDHLNSFVGMVDDLPDLKAIVHWNATPSMTSVTRKDGSEVKIMAWGDLVGLGKESDSSVIEARINSQKPESCCVLVFTSGTTGNPKAVMLSNDNLVYQAKTSLAVTPEIGNDANTSERILSYLPLSHVAGLTVDITVPMMMTAMKPSWNEVYFARPYDMKAGSLGARLAFARPTTFLGVPRVWEKICLKLKAKGAETKGLKKKIVTYCKGKGLEYQNNLLLGGSGVKPSNYALAEKKVFNVVRAALGLQDCKLAISGAAPMPRDVQEFFGALGISINDMYGMSECAGATTVNTQKAHIWGTVGSALPGAEVRVVGENTDIDVPRSQDIFKPKDEENGEIIYRGRHIMLGYYANPKLGEEHVAEILSKNASTIDANGFLHSGDRGVVGTNHFFAITGRFKELIIGAGGENISPVPVEDNVKKIAPGISNFVMIGDKRKFNVALVTLRTVGGNGYVPGSSELDPDVVSIGSPGVTTVEQAMKDPLWIKYIENAIKSTNMNGDACQSNAWKIQKFTILPVDLSTETEELTPTLKTKRAFVDSKYVAVIDSMFDDAVASQVYIPYADSMFVQVAKVE